MSTPTIDDGGPAFPRDSKWNLDGSFCQRGAVGMTLRDWFAGQALTGLCVGYADHRLSIKECSQLALEAADAMIAARNNPSIPHS